MKTILMTLIALMCFAPLVQADIWRDCKKKWGDDQRMVDYCAKKQKEAYKEVKSSRGVDYDIKESCREKWGEDYRMVNYCMGKQSGAQSDLKEIKTSSSTKSKCEAKWGTDYRMVKYCIEKADPMSKFTDEEISKYSGGTISRSHSSSSTGWTGPWVAPKAEALKLLDAGEYAGMAVGKCPKCGSTTAYTDEMRGMEVHCPTCSQPRLIP